MGCLYQLAFPNGKQYIGITMGSATSRFRDHCYDAKRGMDRLVHRAIRKYGVASVVVKTMMVSDSWEILQQAERVAIKEFRTMELGYNMTAGGDGALGYRHSPDSLRKMGGVHRGKAHHNMPHSDESKAAMSASRRGRKLSEETKRKIGEASKGNKYSLGYKHNEGTRRKMVLVARCVPKSTATIGIAGVSIDRQTGKYRATITVRGKTIGLGRFTSIEAATNARRAAELVYFTEGAASWT